MPSLDLRALESRIKSRKLDAIHVFVGEDVKLVDRIVDALEATIDEGDRPFAVERVYAAEPGGMPIDIAAAIRVFPMLGDRRIVIVLRAERFLKPKRASKAAEAPENEEAESADAVDLGPLDEYVDAPADKATLVFVASGIDRTRRFTKRLVEKASVTEFGGLAADGPAGRGSARAGAMEQIARDLAAQNRTIEPRILHTLVERAGGDISRLRDEVERLLLYTEGQSRISQADVDEVVVSHVAVEDEWAVVNAIASGDAPAALRAAAARLDRGDSPHQLIGQLRWWVSSRLSEADAARVRPAVDALMRTDLALKSSAGDERVLVERLIVELTGRPLPDRRWGGRR